MSFFGSMGGMGPTFGGAPSASAFTSPGMNPASLAALLAMQGGVGAPAAPGPQLPNVQSPGAGGGPPSAMGAVAPTPGAAAPTNPLAALTSNPQIMQLLMQMFGGKGGMPGTMGPGTGGLY